MAQESSLASTSRAQEKHGSKPLFPGGEWYNVRPLGLGIMSHRFNAIEEGRHNHWVETKFRILASIPGPPGFVLKKFV